MNDRSVRQISVTIALIAFAIVKVLEDQWSGAIMWLLPGGGVASASGPIQIRLLSSAFAGVKLGLFIVFIEHSLYWIFAHRILGTWAYKSTSGNYAIARLRPQGFWAGGTRITYSVNLYKDPQAVISALERKGVKPPFGTAEGIITSLNNDKLTLIYQVKVGRSASTYPARNGILFLTPSPDPEIMTGVWESTSINPCPDKTPESEFRIGDLEFYRPARFRKLFPAFQVG